MLSWFYYEILSFKINFVNFDFFQCRDFVNYLFINGNITVEISIRCSYFSHLFFIHYFSSMLHSLPPISSKALCIAQTLNWSFHRVNNTLHQNLHQRFLLLSFIRIWWFVFSFAALAWFTNCLHAGARFSLQCDGDCVSQNYKVSNFWHTLNFC